ncbi:polyphosphate kinase 1 [Rubinisphaera margarita]|uniref:polyphosphate kinase 1 n=1 Tax=Rubinisphaera margarita TaxID=2909586 RepID=UPI001EE8F94D|nr:polyphosphate kinase 1 [Rubinisphaera margarita]MCG6154276.1 polyphosphate kinase 1 [Rubinisphaera margarita]
MSNERYINRELSWLEFNQRVLDQARSNSLPLLERVKFLAITASNLDEFFMVRVGGLQLLSRKNVLRPDFAGMTADEQLGAIRDRVREMLRDQYDCYNTMLEPSLSSHGIRRLHANDIAPHQLKVIEERFEDELASILTPIAVWPNEEVPMLPDPDLCLCVRLRCVPDSEEPFRYALIPLGRRLPRFLTVPSESGYEYMLLEDVVASFANRFFPEEQVLEVVPFRMTRNADLTVSDDVANDFMAEMEHLLQARKESHCVRLEIDARATASVQAFLTNAYQVAPADVYALQGPLGLGQFMALASVKGFDNLVDEPWETSQPLDIEPGVDMFEQISQRDILILHPYESFDPVVQLVEEAANDPDVLSIKQTLYRTSSNSPIVNALMKAALSGKYVTAVVELKARFDEARNIEWARQLERVGVQVIYGVRGLKTHAKICVIVRQESQGIRRYVHFGTGNYNEKTSRLYSDVSFMTTDVDLTDDAVAFFNAITAYSQPQPFHKIESAPSGLKDRLLDMIDVEIDQANHGHRAFINAKVNSLVDQEIIDAMYRASAAGVTVRLNIRGICCLRPGIPGLSENITVTSIIDRYLEHARVVHFHHGGDDRIFISSADWMPRNLDRRIELLVPVDHDPCRQRLISILETYFRDNVQATRLESDGSYVPVHDDGEPFRAQKYFSDAIHNEAKKRRDEQLTTFEPHRSPI